MLNLLRPIGPKHRNFKLFDETVYNGVLLPAVNGALREGLELAPLTPPPPADGFEARFVD